MKAWIALGILDGILLAAWLGLRLWKEWQGRPRKAKEKERAKPAEQTEADIRKAARTAVERTNFYNYTGDEQPPVDESAFSQLDARKKDRNGTGHRSVFE